MTDPAEQSELPLARPAARLQIPHDLIVTQPTMLAAIQLCIRASGLEPKEVYLPLGIDPGHWSRIVSGDAHFPVNKLPELMSLCGNNAPLIWLAHSSGHGLVLLKSEAERRADELERQLEEANNKVTVLSDILSGRRVAA